MEITQLNGTRFELALEQFLSGKPLNYQNVSYRLGTDNSLSIVVNSSWHAENITEVRARSDIEEGSRITDYLISASRQFEQIVTNRERQYVLIKDYGKGGVLICRMIGGTIEWPEG